MIEIDKIYQGHAIDFMRTLPGNHVNCIITSPPYWGLRDYGIDPIIWDGDPECPHDFNAEIYTNIHSGSTKSDMVRDGTLNDFNSKSQFCSKCGAWFGSLGLEPTFQLYIQHLIQIFDECKRILRDDGTLWVNIGDTYASSGSQETRFWHGDNPGKHKFNGDGELSKGYSGRCRTDQIIAKCLCDIPFRFSIAMIDSGWIKRNTIIWHKKNCMPSSAKDRFTVDFEYIFFFTKSKRYYFEQQFEPLTDDWETAKKKVKITNKRQKKNIPWRFNDLYRNRTAFPLNPRGRNKRCVWSINTRSFSEAHFATFPETLIEPMIQAGCPEGGLAYDPFMGAGTVAVVAKKLGRHWLGSELNPEYIEMANKRIAQTTRQLKLF